MYIDVASKIFSISRTSPCNSPIKVEMVFDGTSLDFSYLYDIQYTLDYPLHEVTNF
jgi:hypothetical protein